jgi:hypothetical protein
MKAHLCIGGPLDGEHATSEDFYGYRPRDEKGKVIPYHRAPIRAREPGMFGHLRNDYCQFNTASRGQAKSDVVWIYRPLLSGSISPRQR